MLRSTYLCALVAFSVATVCGAEPQPGLRPITQADSVLAVFLEDLGLGSGGTPELIFVAWPDGQLVWSVDRVHGGAPYRTGKADPQRVANLLKRFENDGLFAINRLNQGNFGPDSQFTTVLIRSGRKHVKMQSWHELFESSDKLVVTSRSASALDGEQRLKVLSKEPADYLFFRFVWSETRNKLTELIPEETHASDGKLLVKAGALFWQEPPAKQ